MKYWGNYAFGERFWHHIMQNFKCAQFLVSWGWERPKYNMKPRKQNKFRVGALEKILHYKNIKQTKLREISQEQ